MSDVRDEIDWEWPGDAVTEGQNNYFWQGFVRACHSVVFRGLIYKTLLAEGTSNGHVETGLTDT
ncbi:hypothetical protein C0992_004089, partial [Termitomyces sp. T32_za158]